MLESSQALVVREMLDQLVCPTCTHSYGQPAVIMLQLACIALVHHGHNCSLTQTHMFYAALSGEAIDYSVGTLEGPFTEYDDAQDFCDMKNVSLLKHGIPSDVAFWHVEG